jgi:hypothetical protein
MHLDGRRCIAIGLLDQRLIAHCEQANSRDRLGMLRHSAVQVDHLLAKFLWVSFRKL